MSNLSVKDAAGLHKLCQQWLKGEAKGIKFSSIVASGLQILGLSAKKFARVFHNDPETITRWAKGTQKPQLKLIERLAVKYIAQRARKAMG